MDILLENMPQMVPTPLSPLAELEEADLFELINEVYDQVWTELHQHSHSTSLASKVA
jgi:hypothetical protein